MWPTASWAVCSWYSVIHIPPPELPPYFAEFRRVLAPGGYLLLASSNPRAVRCCSSIIRTPAYRWPIDDLAEFLARKEEFVEVARMLREPLRMNDSAAATC